MAKLEEKGRDIIDLIKKKDRELQGQIQYNKISESRYNVLYKHIVTIKRTEYLNKAGSGNSQKLYARLRCGNYERNNRYWLGEEQKRCTLYKRAEGTLKHMVESCNKLNAGEVTIE